MERYICVLVLMAAFLTGCRDSVHVVENSGSTELYAVDVKSGDQIFGHGTLIPGASSGYIGSMKITKSPAPVLSWKNSKYGEVLSREVLLDQDPGVGEEVVFELDGKTVKFTIRPSP